MPGAPILAALLACLVAAACDSASTPGAVRRGRLLDDAEGVLDAGPARRIRAYLDWVAEEYEIDYQRSTTKRGVEPLARERGARAASARSRDSGIGPTSS
jgi:hypothetical protein